MMTNSGLFTVCLFALSAVAISCDDSDEGLKTQDHDDNEMMAIMHDMISEMNAMDMTGDADHDFASMMVMHHQGAIDMANKELEKGNDATIKAMAQQIVTKQTAEIAELNSWLAAHTPVPNAEGEAFDEEMMKGMEKMTNWKDAQVLTGDTDSDFAQLIIIHHQAAADDANGILHHGHHDDIKEMAKMMIEDQTQEIIDLTAWLKANGPANQ